VAELRRALVGNNNIEVLYRSSVESYRAYVQAIDSYVDESFDLVLIDGRERVQCVEHAMPKVRHGGWLVLDDTDRERYAGAEKFLQAWSKRKFLGLAPGKSEPGHTTLWCKP
jgi:predicted O-methyltransferase YrrM